MSEQQERVRVSNFHARVQRHGVSKNESPTLKNYEGKLPRTPENSNFFVKDGGVLKGGSGGRRGRGARGTTKSILLFLLTSVMLERLLFPLLLVSFIF